MAHQLKDQRQLLRSLKSDEGVLKTSRQRRNVSAAALRNAQLTLYLAAAVLAASHSLPAGAAPLRRRESQSSDEKATDSTVSVTGVTRASHCQITLCRSVCILTGIYPLYYRLPPPIISVFTVAATCVLKCKDIPKSQACHTVCTQYCSAAA